MVIFNLYLILTKKEILSLNAFGVVHVSLMNLLTKGLEETLALYVKDTTDTSSACFPLWRIM